MKDKKLYRKFSNKRVNAKKENIEFCLTFEEYKQLLDEAGITSDDIGIKGYHLARYNDSGSYKLGNCRFITYKENYSEKKPSELAKKTASENIRNFILKVSKEERSNIAKKVAQTRKANNTEHIIWEPLTLDIINDRICIINKYDRSKRGWVMECSRELNISHTQLKRFINKYMKSECNR